MRIITFDKFESRKNNVLDLNLVDLKWKKNKLEYLKN